MGRKKTVEEVILNKLQRPEKVVKCDLEPFNNHFETERTVNRKGNISKRGRMILKTTGEIVEYESALENKILRLLDDSDNIIGIKTQALSLEYFYRGHDTFYYPDIVVLSANGHVGVIEVKDTISMFKAKTVKKYEALQQYCEQNGFYYAMLNDVDDVEGVRNAEVDLELDEFLNGLFETKKSISWASIKEKCKENGWRVKDVLTVVHNNGWKIQSPKSRVWAFSIKK